MEISEFLSRLSGVRGSGEGWTARCPGHDDRRASLCVRADGEGRILVRCQAGCETGAVLSRMGLSMRDLFPAKGRRPVSVAATYDYVDEAGGLLYQVVRTKSKGFFQRRRVGGGWSYRLQGVRRVLYRLPQVIRAVRAGETLFVVEGEKDVHSLAAWGFTATTNSGGSNGKWPDSCDEHLSGGEIVVIPDNDPPGRAHAEAVAEVLSGRARVRVLSLPGLSEHGDFTDWVEAGGTREEFERLVADCPERVSDGLPMNDLGNARRLVKKHGAKIRYCCDAGKWLIWDGARWKDDETGELFRMAAETADDLLRAARSFPEQRAFERFAVNSGNHRSVQAMVGLAGSLSHVLARELDADPWLLNTANGILDLRTGELRPHDPAAMITKLVPVPYDPAAECPTWERFLSEVFQGDTELIGFIHRAAGYTLTGDTREQVFFILHGRGSNGKSTFLGTLREVMGDYEQKTSTETLIERERSSTNDLAALRGARFVSAIETSAGKRLAEALVKELTGQDAVVARFLYREFFSYVPTFKLWLACNHVPSIQGQDHGIWRRIRLIPFDVQFADPGTAVGPYKDKGLPERLRAEYPGILAWLVRGCLAWQRDGLPVPRTVSSATSTLQQEMDQLGGFLAECCVLRPEAEVSARELYAAYGRWAERVGERPLSQRFLGLRLSERGVFKKERRREGFVWHGLGLAGM
ncbi:MAG: phage/plasmid primase, P4 family [Armatimonadota bacterium]